MWQWLACSRAMHLYTIPFSKFMFSCVKSMQPINLSEVLEAIIVTLDTLAWPPTNRTTQSPTKPSQPIHPPSYHPPTADIRHSVIGSKPTDRSSSSPRKEIKKIAQDSRLDQKTTLTVMSWHRHTINIRKLRDISRDFDGLLAIFGMARGAKLLPVEEKKKRSDPKSSHFVIVFYFLVGSASLPTIWHYHELIVAYYSDKHWPQ